MISVFMNPAVKSFDLVAIGDTTIDAFIRLRDARVHCDVNDERCELCVRFADKVPYESVTVVPAVGNASNAAVSAARLGLKTAFVANIGDDDNGKLSLAQWKKEGVDTSFIDAQAGRATNYHYVWWYEDERTIFVKHNEYSYRFPDIGNPSWVYLSSLGENTLNYHEEISFYLNAHKGVKLAFQPGTFQIKMGADALAAIYERTEAFFCNKEEAQRILGTRTDDVKKLMTDLRRLGPRIVAITDGPKGAYASDGEEAWFIPMYPDPKPPLQRTGAGDAFSSTFVVALTLGEPVERALAWGPINSAYVVQEIGAQKGLLSRKELEDFLKKAPKDYVPTKI